MATFIHEYVQEFRELTKWKFSTRYRVPVLIGIGVVGDLQDPLIEFERGATIGASADVLALAMETESLAGRVWLIQRGSGSRVGAAIIVGRAAGNDLVIPEYSMSRTHCLFKISLTGVEIVDLGSTNGTVVRGHVLRPRQAFKLKDSDEIVMGRYQFEFLTNDGFVRRISKLVGS